MVNEIMIIDQHISNYPIDGNQRFLQQNEHGAKSLAGKFRVIVPAHQDAFYVRYPNGAC